jgi:hypothetical protein
MTLSCMTALGAGCARSICRNAVQNEIVRKPRAGYSNWALVHQGCDACATVFRMHAKTEVAGAAPKKPFRNSASYRRDGAAVQPLQEQRLHQSCYAHKNLATMGGMRLKADLHRDTARPVATPPQQL